MTLGMFLKTAFFLVILNLAVCDIFKFYYVKFKYKGDKSKYKSWVFDKRDKKDGKFKYYLHIWYKSVIVAYRPKNKPVNMMFSSLWIPTLLILSCVCSVILTKMGLAIAGVLLLLWIIITPVFYVKNNIRDENGSNKWYLRLIKFVLVFLVPYLFVVISMAFGLYYTYINFESMDVVRTAYIYSAQYLTISLSMLLMILYIYGMFYAMWYLFVLSWNITVRIVKKGKYLKYTLLDFRPLAVLLYISIIMA